MAGMLASMRSLFLGKMEDLIKGFGLNIQLPQDLIHFFFLPDHQLRIAVAFQFLILIDPADTGIPDRFRDGFCFKDHPVDIVIPVLEILDNAGGLIKIVIQDLELQLQLLDLPFLHTLLRRVHKIECEDQYYSCKYHTRRQMGKKIEQLLSEGCLYPVKRQRFFVELILYLAH